MYGVGIFIISVYAFTAAAGVPAAGFTAVVGVIVGIAGFVSAADFFIVLLDYKGRLFCNIGNNDTAFHSQAAYLPSFILII